MAKHVLRTDVLMQPIAHFSHAARVGNLIHVGATAGTDAARRLAGTSAGLVDAAAQIHQTFDNLETVLRLLGASAKHLVKIKAYAVDMRDMRLYEKIHAERFGGQMPCHVLVGSWGFPLPQAAVELDAVAIIDEPIERLPGGAVRAGARFYGTALGADSASALQALSQMLSSARMTLKDIVNLHVTLVDDRDLAEVDSQFKKALPGIFPSRTVVIAPLSDTGMRVQVECVAQAGGGKLIGKPSESWGAADAMMAGDELFISAQTGRDSSGDLANGAELQARAAWERLGRILAEAGMSPDQVVRTNNVLADWRDYAAFNAGYGANVTEPYPPRTTVVAGMRQPRARVQIEAIAHRDGSKATVLDVKK
jgi:enamine deaminase RidA (YjgF/YER057c/UK114 family)